MTFAYPFFKKNDNNYKLSTNFSETPLLLFFNLFLTCFSWCAKSIKSIGSRRKNDFFRVKNDFFRVNYDFFRVKNDFFRVNYDFCLI